MRCKGSVTVKAPKNASPTAAMPGPHAAPTVLMTDFVTLAAIDNFGKPDLDYGYGQIKEHKAQHVRQQGCYLQRLLLKHWMQAP